LDSYRELFADVVQQAVASDIKGLIQSSVTAVDGGVRHVKEAGMATKDIVSSVQRPSSRPALAR